MSIYSSLKSSGASSAGTTLSLTAPTSPSDGTMWYDTSDGTLYIRTGSIWVEAVVAAAGASANPLPTGNTAQRPGSPTVGNMRINSETNYVEVYYSSSWFNLTYIGLVTASSTNSTVSYSGNYVIHTFNSTGTFTTTNVPVGGTVECLVIAGGGAGGYGWEGGGGGAGGLVYSTSQSIPVGSYVVTVGAGAPSGANNGNDSSIVTILSAVGGGRGSGEPSGSGGYAAAIGGSGGGGGQPLTAGAAGTAGQGNAGGNGYSSGSTWGGGGGGGAGAAGTNAISNVSGSGGVGLVNSITGSAIYYAGGGGGCTRAGDGALGGNGGGGAGNGSAAATAGTANRGGGGGGSSSSGGTGASSTSGAGGSGIVIIRYRYQ